MYVLFYFASIFWADFFWFIYDNRKGEEKKNKIRLTDDYLPTLGLYSYARPQGEVPPSQHQHAIRQIGNRRT